MLRGDNGFTTREKITSVWKWPHIQLVPQTKKKKNEMDLHFDYN